MRETVTRPDRRGIAAIGLTQALRTQFGDGEEHTIDEAVSAVAHLIPPEIAARKYLRSRPRAAWPPKRYAAALYAGQRLVVVDRLRAAGATWKPGARPRTPITRFQLQQPCAGDPPAPTPPDRRTCPGCGEPLAGRRRQSTTCSDRCRGRMARRRRHDQQPP